MNNDLISVIVAVFNVEQFLDRCIESIVTQTHKNLEIILVDDGSTDGSGNICDEWEKKDFRIHALHKSNGGSSDARNFGLQAAHGKWIGFIDGDDYVNPDMYDNLFEKRVKDGIIICGYYRVENMSTTPVRGENRELTQEEAANLYLDNELNSISSRTFTYFGSYAWNKLYAIDVFNDIKYPKNKNFEDMYIMLELIHNSSMIRIIPECEYYYIQRKNSVTHLKTIQTDALEARQKQKEELKKFWNIQDTRIDKLITLEYFSILKKYAIIPKSQREKYADLRKNAWNNLRQMGYDDFSLKNKLKLFLCISMPEFYHILYGINERAKCI